MAHIEEMAVIHRDLAARNVLVKDKNTYKIADFGLARITEDSVYNSTAGKVNYEEIDYLWNKKRTIHQIKTTHHEKKYVPPTFFFIFVIRKLNKDRHKSINCFQLHDHLGPEE